MLVIGILLYIIGILIFNWISKYSELEIIDRPRALKTKSGVLFFVLICILFIVFSFVIFFIVKIGIIFALIFSFFLILMVLNFINRKLFRKRNKVYFANLKSEQFKFKKTHEKYIEKIYRNEDGQPVYEYDFHETVSTDEKNKILSDTIFYISNNKLEYDLLTSDGDILLNKKRFDEAKKNI